MIFLEISNWFVNMRWLLFQHGYSGASLLQSINSVLLCIAFIFGRVFYQLNLCIFYAIPWWNKTLRDEEVSLGYKALICEMAILIFCNVLMNLYWASLIIAQLKRVLARGFSSDNVEVGGLEREKKTGEVEMHLKKETLDPLLEQDASKEN